MENRILVISYMQCHHINYHPNNLDRISIRIKSLGKQVVPELNDYCRNSDGKDCEVFWQPLTTVESFFKKENKKPRGLNC